MTNWITTDKSTERNVGCFSVMIFFRFFRSNPADMAEEELIPVPCFSKEDKVLALPFILALNLNGLKRVVSQIPALN